MTLAGFYNQRWILEERASYLPASNVEVSDRGRDE